MAHRLVAEQDDGIRLDRWFARHYPGVQHALLEKYLRRKQVRLEGKKAKAGDRIAAGQRVEFPDTLPAKAPTAPARQVMDEKASRIAQSWVIYKDRHLLAINKPAGLAVQGGSGQARHVDGMLDGLRFEASERPKLVHRLDKDTSGVLLLARDAKTAAELSRRFGGRDIEKTYIALVRGVPKPREGRIDLPLAKLADGKFSREQVEVEEGGGKNAVTEYRVIESLAQKLAWMELKPITGRTHQLRVHMAALGHPILGDGKYGGERAFIEGLNLPAQLHLHARKVVLPNWQGKTLTLTAKLPPHMQQSAAMLGTEIEDD